MLTIYKASAGSGKTFTLAREYILLLLGIKDVEAAAMQGNVVPGAEPRPYRLNLIPGPTPRLAQNNRHRAILAITFTRKATEEMKSRIISELRKLAQSPNDSDYAADLERDLHCSRADLSACSRLALKQLLFDYQNFNVSTIDAFFQRVLHTFARELDIQSDYSIELSDHDAMKAAVGTMLDNFNISAPGSTPLESWLYSFMTEKIEEGAQGNILNRQSGVHRSLVKQLSKIGQESFKPYFEKMKAYLSHPSKPIEKFRRAVAAQIKPISEEIRAIAMSAFGPGGVPIDWIAVKSVAQNMQAIIDGADVSVSDLCSTAFFRDLANGSSEKSPFKKGKGNADQAAIVQSAFADILRLSARREYLQTIRSSLTQLSLLSFAWPYLELFTKDNNTLLLSNTNHLLKQIIGACETPFVYEKMGMRLKHFLIDEFQDTSQMQWDNLRPLVQNDIEEQDSLVIGDEKQSIYRFRNSDSGILHSQVQADFGPYSVSTGHEPEKNTNYRSSADVIRFNNTLFSIIAEQLGIDGYENVVQSIKKANLSYRGMVRCVVRPKAEEDVFRQMADQILRQISEGQYRQSDIAILVNTNKEARRVIEFILANYQGVLNVASDEALMVASSSAVQMVISVLKSIDQESSRPGAEEAAAPKSIYPSRAEVMRKINRYQYFMGREANRSSDPKEAAKASTRAMLHALSDAPAPELGVDGVLNFRPDSLPALIDDVIHIHFSPEERTKHGAYLCALLDAAAEYCANNVASLHGFIDWWNEQSKNLTIGADSNANALKVMTIHKSKGLEFHCVHIPLCNWSLSMGLPPDVWTTLPPEFAQSIFPSLSPEQSKRLAPPAMFVKLLSVNALPDSPFHAEYAKERREAIADALNKTYVAFTRAKSELCIWYKPAASGSSIGFFLRQAFAKGMPAFFRPDAMLNLASIEKTEDGNVWQLGFPTVIPDDDKEKGSRINKFETIPYAVYPIEGKSLLMGADQGRELEKDIDDVPPPPAPVPADDDSAEAMDLLQDGLAMHEIMSRVLRPADVDRAVRLVCGRLRLEAGAAARYADLAHSIVEMPAPEIRRWFADFDRALVEAPIYLRDGDSTRRPDRVVVCPDGCVDIVDYKFTSNPSHVGLDAHVAQVRQYASLMRDMGHARVRAYLLYPRLRRIVPVES
ncbi:MAG: UvrD-helicase domain-containing protein [Clostridium sp.]|nr:UvrD-helicase domain-containing protein [Clostridium sp.]